MNSPKNGLRFYLRYWLVARPGCEGPPGMGLRIFGVSLGTGPLCSRGYFETGDGKLVSMCAKS